MRCFFLPVLVIGIERGLRADGDEFYKKKEVFVHNKLIQKNLSQVCNICQYLKYLI